VIGCHGLVWTGRFDAEGLRRAVSGTLYAGYELLEIPLLDPFGFDREAGRAVLTGSGLRVAASLGLPMGADSSTAEPEQIARAEDVLRRALEVVHDLGGQDLCGVLYGSLRKYPAPATPGGRQASQDVLRQVAVRAAELGVTLSLEVVNRYEANQFNTARTALEYLNEIGDPSIKVHLDTYHMNIEESDLFSPVLEAGDRIGYVHIGESHRGYLGTGTVAFDEFFRALHTIGFTGPITFESFSTAVVDEELSRSLAIWRNLWQDGDDLAKHANAFIRNKIRANETLAMH